MCIFVHRFVCVYIHLSMCICVCVCAGADTGYWEGGGGFQETVKGVKQRIFKQNKSY